MNALIHKAVRRDLQAFTAALTDFPARDAARATALAARFRLFDTQLTHHHHGEEQILWPILRGNPTDAAEVGQLTGEHERILDRLAAARQAMAQFGRSASATDAQAAHHAIVDLTAAAEKHFAHEEGEVAELLAHADHDAAIAAFKKMGRDAPMRQGLWFIQWVSDGATPQETAFLRTLIPGPVHWISKAVAGRGYGKMSAELRV